MTLRLVHSLFLSLLLLPAAQAQQAVTFATNWKAQAAHGGFYQAVADGTYKKHGLDVTIRQGGPQVNNRPLLPAKRIDFLMTGNLLHSFDNVKNGVPVVVVAAMFQSIRLTSSCWSGLKKMLVWCTHSNIACVMVWIRTVERNQILY